MKSLTNHLFLLIALLAVVKGTNAQVGINVTTPNKNVILDIKSANKGVLLPRPQDISIVDKIDGSLVYDSVSHKFKYCNVDKWLTVNPLNPDVNDNVTAPRSLTVTENLTVNGTTVSIPNATTVNVSNALVTANTFVGNGTIPVGGIIMWSGGTTIPNGWALCDGTNGTPNLQGRFILGYDKSNSTSPLTGGSNSVTLEEVNLPTHQHKLYTTSIKGGGPGDITGVVGYNTSDKSGLTDFAGGVYHPAVLDWSGSKDRYTCDINDLLEPANKNDCLCYDELPVDEFTGLLDMRRYYNNKTECYNKNYNPNYGEVATPEYWTTSPFDNRPAYYILAFIMRIR